jgi:hypothetical protein
LREESLEDDKFGSKYTSSKKSSTFEIGISSQSFSFSPIN